MNLRYFITPEDSTHMLDQGIDFSFNFSLRGTIKTALWITISVLLCVALGGLK